MQTQDYASNPRKLEKIRQNGQEIMNATGGFNKSNGLDAHKQYTRNQAGGQQHVSAAHNIGQGDLDVELDLEGQTKMHLVPCRWTRSGWKYVEVDPKEHNFFNNPNRVNSFGIQSPSKQPRKA